MTLLEAQEMAEKMSLETALTYMNQGKGIPYKKAVKERLNKNGQISYNQGQRDMQNFVENKCRELGIDYISIFTCESI